MNPETVDVTNACGAVLVRATDAAGTQHRYWFDTTDESRLVLCAEVLQMDEIDDFTAGRQYVDVGEMMVPDAVRDELGDSGYDAETIYDVDGQPLR